MFTEEDILLLLLPQLRRKLNIEKLKPHLKLLCSITDEECYTLLNRKASEYTNCAADTLVALLRKKSPHCCARILLSALKHSSSSTENDSNHLVLIELLQAELRDMSKRMERVSSQLEGKLSSVGKFYSNYCYNCSCAAVHAIRDQRVPGSNQVML